MLPRFGIARSTSCWTTTVVTLAAGSSGLARAMKRCRSILAEAIKVVLLEMIMVCSLFGGREMNSYFSVHHFSSFFRLLRREEIMILRQFVDGFI